MRKKAVSAIQKAKKAESLNTPSEELFHLYQEAYVLFEDLNTQIHKAEDEADYLKKKATRKDILSVISIVIGVIGIIIGIVSCAPG